jgi:hypothetical protein
LEYGTFVITFINLFIADVQVPQRGFEGSIQEGKSTKTEEKLNHINQWNNLKTIVIFLTLYMYFLKKMVG